MTPAIVFLLPWSAENESRDLAPAFMVTAFEGLHNGFEAAERGGFPLLFGLSGAYCLVFIYHLVLLRESKK